jgi:predicted Rossmann-fold nucleotide-binding protein
VSEGTDKLVIAVFGGSEPDRDREVYAKKLGRAIAERGRQDSNLRPAD